VPLYSTACPLPLSRKIFRHRASAPFSPADLTGLSLWLKADAGISTGNGTPFISSVIISGAGSTTSNGTYTRTSGGYTTFTKSGGNYIAYGYNSTADGDVWYISDATLDNVSTYYAGDEGTISGWQIDQGSANAPSSTTSNTTPTVVTNWADQSGNGNNAAATDTPTLSTVSGKTFVDFAGGYFTGNELITSPYTTIMCVARFSSTRDIEIMFQQYSDGDNLALYRGFDLDKGYRIYNGENLSSNSLTNDNETYLFGVTVNNDTGTFYLNSTADGNGYCGEITPAGAYYLGFWQGGGLPTIELQMAEIVVYNRVLTTPERQQVEAYLNTKYAIY
jgi:hypothetical protein